MKPPSIADVHSFEQHALVTEGALAVVPPWAAVRDLDTVIHLPSAFRREHPSRIGRLRGARLGNAVVQYNPTLQTKFLWCHVNNNRYRIHYRRFLQQEYGWTSAVIPPDWHVDHVFNRARAKSLDLSWIRMIVLPDSINTSHGAGYEAGRTRSDVIGRPGRDRKIDEVVLAKVCGIPSPRRGEPPSQQMIDHARRIARAHGIPEQTVLENIDDLLAI